MLPKSQPQGVMFSQKLFFKSCKLYLAVSVQNHRLDLNRHQNMKLAQATAFPGNLILSLLPFPCFSSFVSPVPKLKRRRQDDALGCQRWDIKEKEAVSDSKWKYFIDFSGFESGLLYPTNLKVTSMQ